MKNGKLKMSNKRFLAIMIPILAILLAVIIVLTVAANLFAVWLDETLGRGERHVVHAEGTENWDSDYYEDSYADNNASKEASYKLAQEVQEEGSVLLKNNGVLPLAKNSKVTPFGYAYIEPIYGQVTSSGSAKWTISPTTPEAGIKDVFTVNNAAVDKMKAAGKPTAVAEAAGTLSAGQLNELMRSGDSLLYEHPATIYSGIENSVAGSTGIVFIARAGQEGADKKYDGYTDGTPHYLALSQNEKETIRFAKSNCDKVVVVIASSAAMELGVLMSGDLEADAILQVGHVGEKGFAALGKLLCGDVNPSGRTVDIWAADFTKDPTYANFGEFTYTNATFKSHAYGTPSSAAGDGSFYRYYIEYAEDVYMGYRYYETAAVEDTQFDYAKAVVYPFGYGLSYTDFKQEITSFRDVGNQISVTVKITNEGDRAGKDVVQLYYSAPYTEFDKTNKIEKSAVNLAAFTKTKLLNKGASDTVTLTFAKEEMASYCYTHDNGDGTKGCYVLENGEYSVSLRKNSHDVIDTKTTTIASTVWYDNDNPRQSEKDGQSALDAQGNILGYPEKDVNSDFVAATNQFEYSNTYMQNESKILSRADWKNTFPEFNASRQKAASAETVKLFGIEETFDPETDKLLGNAEGSAVYSKEDNKVADSGIKLSDMRGIPYYDDLWDTFLNQIDFTNEEVLNQIVAMMTGANYTTTQVDALELPTVKHADGANGIKAVKTDAGMELSATYGYAPLMASTWNVELMERVGNMFGREAMENGITGWYSPAINLHRSPFSGRVFEYYSEDPVLTGKIASAVVSGAGDAGMYCYIKHFALNDQETNREFLLHTWATEQAMRELYLKAFEIPFKEARMTVKYISDDQGTVSTRVMRAATAVMASQNDIGVTIAHGNYALLTKVLRDEWGFKGTVHSDMYVWMAGKNMYDLTFRSGCDTFLTYAMLGGMQDKTSPTAHAVMRRAVHDVCYTVVNSSAMQGVTPGSIIYYDMSPWAIWLIVANVVVYALIAAGTVWCVLRTIDSKKHPENYKSKETV